MKTAGTIAECVAARRYEEALGLPLDAPIREAERMAILCSRRHGPDIEAVHAVNRAAAMLRAERDKPEDRTARYLAIGVEMSSNDRKEESLVYLSKAVELGHEAHAYHWLGSTLVQLGRPQEAMPYLQRAVELRGDPTDNDWFNEARRSLAIGMGSPHRATPASDGPMEQTGIRLPVRRPSQGSPEMADWVTSLLTGDPKAYGRIADRIASGSTVGRVTRPASPPRAEQLVRDCSGKECSVSQLPDYLVFCILTVVAVTICVLVATLG